MNTLVVFSLLVAAVLAEPQYFYSGVPASYYGGVYPAYTGYTGYNGAVVSPVLAKNYVPAVAYASQDTSRGIPQPVQDTAEDDWRARVRGAQQLKAALRSSAAVERLRSHLPEFLAFLESMLEDSSPRVVAATLATYARLAEALGQRLKPHARHVAGALCRPAATPRAEVKLEAAHAAKSLMTAVGVQTACAALAESLRARSHRHREAALQLVTLGLLAFPSSQFDAPDIAQRVIPALADSKRRVRQAALEVTAVLGQFVAPTALPVHLATERLRSRQSQEALHAAVNARLSRRTLPSLSPEGLILYSLQLPAHAARGLPGTPTGADVEWILAGSGSTSPGSARSRAQLNAAARRASSEDSLADEPPLNKPTRERSHSRRRQSSQQQSIEQMGQNAAKAMPGPLPGMEHGEDVTWALLPVGSMQVTSMLLCRVAGFRPLAQHFVKDEALGPVWTAEIAGGDVADGVPRPMFLRLLRRQPEHVAAMDKERGYILLPSKQLASPARSPRHSRHVAHHQEQGAPAEGNSSPIPLRPTLARAASSERRGSSGSSFDSEEAPPQRSSSLRRTRREKRHVSDSLPSPRHQALTELQASSSPPGSPNPIPQKPVLARRRLSSPSLKHADDISLVEVVPIDVALGLLGARSPSRPTSGELFPSLNNTPPALGAEPTKRRHYFDRPPDIGHDTPLITKSSTFFVPPSTPKVPQAEHVEQPEPLRTQTSPRASPVAANALENTARSPVTATSVSSEAAARLESPDSSDLGVVTKPLPPRARPARSIPSSRSRSQGRGSSGSGGSSTGSTSSLQAAVDGPVRRPQDALSQCQMQLGSQDWETVIVGLTMLRRIVAYHPEIVSSNLHGVVMDVARQIRNLRSQVARLACGVAAQLAMSLRRGLENELEELFEPLLHRTADTNRFIREDCGKALDQIMENAPPSRTIPALISQGAAHRNAVVRASTARLLCEIVTRLGADRVMGAASPGGASPGAGISRDVRSKVLKTAATQLIEGSLETRTWAKKTFQVLVNHETFDSNLTQAVTPNLMFAIQKPLTALRRIHN